MGAGPGGGGDTAGVSVVAVTAFGSPYAEPARTAAVLRARAAGAGLELAAAPEPELIAGVVGAHAYLSALRPGSLGFVPDQAAAAALAAVYCRAAGRAASPVPCEDLGLAEMLEQTIGLLDAHAAADLEQSVLAEIEQAAAWAMRHGAGLDVLVAAAHDLTAGAADGRIAGAAEALLTLAGLTW